MVEHPAVGHGDEQVPGDVDVLGVGEPGEGGDTPSPS